MPRRGDAAAEAVAIGLAIGFITEVLIAHGRSISDQSRRDMTLAIAMGVIHGCCGPNGDFTANYRGVHAAPD